MGHNRNSLQGGYIGVIQGITIGVIKGDTRSLDYGSYYVPPKFGDIPSLLTILDAGRALIITSTL